MHTLASFMLHIFVYTVYTCLTSGTCPEKETQADSFPDCAQWQDVREETQWIQTCRLKDQPWVSKMETGCDTRTPMALCKKARSSQRAWTTSALLCKAPCYAKIYQYKNAVCTQESPFQRFSRMGWWHLLFFKSRSAWDRMYNTVFTLQDKVDNNVRGDRNWSLVNFEW